MHLHLAVPALSAKRATLPLLSLGLLLANSLFAQGAPAPTSDQPTKPARVPTAAETAAAGAAAKDDAIVLSPFEVSGGGDTGYSAATTLAGNRLNTNLRDVGSAISVVTEQFLRDTGAFNNETLLQYTTNTEVGNIYGNMSGANNVQSTQTDETSKFVAPNMNTRVRGLASADNTMDFFLTDIPWDGYAVDRIDMQRGPNSILFGLGSPSGIINAGTKQASLSKNRGQIEARYGSFNSLRTSLDYNLVVVPKQLAIRLDALRNDENFQQKPAYSRDERIYGTIRYEPAFLNRSDFAHTTLRANYEHGHINSNRPRTVPPGDVITPFFYTGTASGFTATGDPFTYNNINRAGFDARGLNDGVITATQTPGRGEFPATYTVNGTTTVVNNPLYQPWLGGQFAAGYFGNPMAIFNGVGTGTPVQLANWEPNTRNGLNSAGNIDGSIQGMYFSRMSSLTIYRDWARKTNQPGAKFGLTRNLVITDPSVFDFYNNLIDGPNKSEWQNFHRFNLNLSQTFFKGDVGIEAAMDRQYFDNGQLVFMTDKGQALYIDPIKTMADGTANPNFGRPFIADSVGNNRVTFIDRNAERVTGFVQHDFAKGEHRNLFTRFIGRHILTGIYNKEERQSDSRRFFRYGTDLAYKDFAFGATSIQNFDSSNRAIYPVIYLGPSVAGATSASGLNIGRPQSEVTAVSGSIRIFDSTWAAPAGVNPSDPWTNTDFPVGFARRTSTQSENPANYKGWTTVPLKVIDSEAGNRDALTAEAQLTKSSVAAKAFVWNGYLWDGALVGMYGWRRDTSKAWSFSAVRTPATATTDGTFNLDPSVYHLPSAYRDRIDQDSTSWSIVAHLSKILPRERLPVDVSFFYNKSENFAASAGRVGVLNESLGPPRGNTTDKGIVISTKDGKYTFKYNRYVSRSQNASTSAFNPFFLPTLFTNYTQQKNVYKYQIDGNVFNLSGTQGTDPNRWTWQPRAGQTPDQALADESASIVSWEKLVASVPKEFFTAYQINVNNVEALSSISPAGLTATESNLSRGEEYEFSATPIRSLRLTFNASKQVAFRSNIGPDSLTNVVNIINTALNNTPAGLMRSSSSGNATTALVDWNNNFYAQYAPVKFTESTAVPELRKWRANFIANYDFREGVLKNVNIGMGYRWQGKVIIGYKPDYFDFAGNKAANPQVATVWRPLYDQPYYGPAETNIDGWIGYKHQISKKVSWRVQLNVRNIGKGDYLIPVNVQPDGTPAAYRIAPVQTWSLTNTFDF